MEGNSEEAGEKSSGQSEPGKRRRRRQQCVALRGAWSSTDAPCWMEMREMAVGKAEECLGFSLERLGLGLWCRFCIVAVVRRLHSLQF